MSLDAHLQSLQARTTTCCSFPMHPCTHGLRPPLNLLRLAPPAARYGLHCEDCVERQDYMQQLVHRLTLPVRLADGVGSSGGSGHVEALEQPFLHNAYTQQLHEESGEVGA